ncbi:MarR family winged helix-turn-helix transcriptional regulator [Paenibacillus lentus]|uniref:MarR family winged helix-turn-helix transcriptional regulator n=1 Tax=Paenibacillus lentus TaxID=1338368 RepID=UPI00365A326B
MNEELLSFVREINEIEYACNTMLAKEYAGLLDESITNSQIIMLGHIHKHGRLLTGELSKMMNITPSAVSQTLNKLEKGGYIKRSINPGNRREIFVELDIKGVSYIDRNEEIEKSIINRFYSKLDMADLKALRDIMRKFKQIIEKEQNNL